MLNVQGLACQLNITNPNIKKLIRRVLARNKILQIGNKFKNNFLLVSRKWFNTIYSNITNK